MILEKIKVAVQTSTKVKFITAIPVTITIREALPIIFKAYQAVVKQNFEDEECKELLNGNRITSITKNGFLIPLAEEVIHVLNDSDNLFISIGKHESKKENESKKEKLQSKKEEKKLERIKERLVEQKKAPQEQEKKDPKPSVQKQQKSVEQKKEIKKQEQKRPESNFAQKDIAKLLSLVKGQPANKPQKVVEKAKKVIVQTPSQSSDSD